MLDKHFPDDVAYSNIIKIYASLQYDGQVHR